jgi:hypothetical protein
MTTHAQSNDPLTRGVWKIDTPNEGSLVIVLKTEGRASYFWGDNTDRTVYQGTWTSDDDSVTLNWADGSRHRIVRDQLAFVMTYFSSNGSEQYTVQAQQVPEEILGQWAKAPTKEKELISDRDKAKGFFGIWKVGDSDANTEYVLIEPDRSAATTEGGSNGLRGSWARQGSELHIAWDSGQYSILRPNQREFNYKIIQSGHIIEDDESEMRPAARTIAEKVPSTWMTTYQQEREVHSGGIAFASRKDARTFYRGDWVIKLSDGTFERIELERFGGLKTSTDPSLEGDWRMQGQDIFLRWDNGTRKILSPIGRGFVIYEFKPGRPLDGVPTRLYAAAPADSAKLAEHLKVRAEVAQQMSDLANAAGIDPNQQEAAGWGRTFARWAWPFGEDESMTSSEALLQEEYEDSSKADPWWWPFWSERTASPSESTAEAEDATTEAAESAPAATQVPATDTVEDGPAKTEKKNSSRDWAWPF